MPQIKKILVPTDFSENASAAYKFAKKTAESYGAQVDFIHIIPKMHYFNVSLNALDYTFESGKMYPKLREEATEKLQEEMQKQLAPEHRGEAIVKIENRASTAIAEHAKKGRYDLILMASRGQHESEFLRGSVTEKVIRFAHTPVLALNKAYNPEIKTIVVPIDGSEISMEALPMALLIAAHRKAVIKLLTISEFDGSMIKVQDERSYKYTDEEVSQKAFTALKDFVTNNSNKLAFEKKPEDPGSTILLRNDEGETVKLEIEVRKGFSPYQAIAGYAKDNAQLVVMATHGRTGLANFFLGSTAEKVVRHLKLPVMTVKPEAMKKVKNKAKS